VPDGRIRRPKTKEVSFRGHVNHHAQGAMIIVAHRDEAEWLQNTFGRTHRREHLGHSVHGPVLSAKRYFDKIALAQGASHTEQAAGGRNRLQFAFGLLAVFEHHERGNGASQRQPRGAPLRVRLGEMCHGHTMALSSDYQKLLKADVRIPEQFVAISS